MKSQSMAPRFDIASLESIESARHTPDFSAVWQRLAKLFNISALLESLVTSLSGPVEPQIYQRHDRRGDVYYQLYDPKTDRQRMFKTEQDIRIWLDQRY